MLSSGSRFNIFTTSIGMVMLKLPPFLETFLIESGISSSSGKSHQVFMALCHLKTYLLFSQQSSSDLLYVNSSNLFSSYEEEHIICFNPHIPPDRVGDR